jgi:zinc protease
MAAPRPSAPHGTRPPARPAHHYGAAAGPLAYTDFGKPGVVVEDKREPHFGIRQIRFANGVRLNLKHTNLSRQSVLVHLAIDGGQMLATSDNPLAVEMTAMMGTGALANIRSMKCSR